MDELISAWLTLRSQSTNLRLPSDEPGDLHRFEVIGEELRQLLRRRAAEAAIGGKAEGGKYLRATSRRALSVGIE